MIHTDVVILGAGAAGMFCAATAGQRGRRVIMLDHARKPGEKIRISGGGRCNFTHLDANHQQYLSQNPHFARSALSRYTPRDFVDLVERHGIRYWHKTPGRLFCEDSAEQIIAMLWAECSDGHVDSWLDTRIEDIQALDAPTGDGARFHIRTSRGDITCASVVVATGGLAIPKIGATDLGYRIARQFGLPIIEPRPALVPLSFAPEFSQCYGKLAGISFEAVLRCGAGEFREDVLITHRGLSGPGILQVSSYWQAERGEGRIPIHIDLFPGRSASDWLTERQGRKSKLGNLLAEHVPARLAEALCAEHGLDSQAGWHQLAPRLRQKVEHMLADWQITPSGTLGFAKAEVTLGGVDTRALSSKTMEARQRPGLHFVGEVVDVTGWLGGYNFQWAWSSGWAAGQAV